MNILRSIAMAFSMFSKLPAPRVEWKKGNMGYMLAFFPLVGCVSGALLLLWSLLSRWLGLGVILTGAGLTLTPVLFTGGIHMDGLCDTMDALSSHASPEKKREILKDSHAGAFAIISLCVYFLAYFALCSEVANTLPLCLIPVISRSLSGLAGVCFPVCSGNGLLRQFSDSAARTPAIAILSAFFVLEWAALFFLGGLYCVFIPAAALICLIYVYFMSKKQFGGMSGDISGYLLQLSELIMLAALVLCEKVV